MVLDGNPAGRARRSAPAAVDRLVEDVQSDLAFFLKTLAQFGRT